MKRLILSVALLLGAFLSSFGQGISIRVVQPERPNLSAESCQRLQTLMTEMLSRSGMVENLPSNRFVLTAKASILSKDIIAGTPTKVSERLNITFMVGDIVNNQVFSTCPVKVTGVGENEEQAIHKAINTIKPGNAIFQAFITEANNKIINYYVANEQAVIKLADKLANEGKYEEALYELCLVPAACGKTYDKCQEKVLEVIQEMYDVQGAKLLTEAKAIWAGTLNRDGAERLLPVIKDISPYATCYAEALDFLEEIGSKLTADAKREWDFMVKQYEDEVQFKNKLHEDEMQIKNKELDAAIDKKEKEMKLREIEIKAARDVAIEKAKNQPEVIYESYAVPVLLW